MFSCCGGIPFRLASFTACGGVQYAKDSNMHAVFLLLLAVSLATVRSSTATGRTVPAEYTRTVSYDGDVVVRW